MDYPFEMWSDELKEQMHKLIDDLFETGISFTMHHTYGFNQYERDKGNDLIEMILLKRHFYIGIKEPVFYMVHDHLGEKCTRVVDRTDFNSLEELEKKIEELLNE